MSVKYRVNDVFVIAVDGLAVPGRILREIHGNVLVAVYADEVQSAGVVDVDLYSDLKPTFLAVTMDIRIVDGDWPVLGNREPSIGLPIPVYKVHVHGSDDYFEQHFDGSVGRRLTADEADRLKTYKSYSPALLEMAVRAFRGLAPWRPVFDEIRLAEPA